MASLRARVLEVVPTVDVAAFSDVNLVSVDVWAGIGEQSSRARTRINNEVLMRETGGEGGE